MTNEERSALIDQLDRSFQAMSTTDKMITKHAMAAPPLNPSTGKPFKDFKEVISEGSDDTLLVLKEDFDDNGLLLPILVSWVTNLG